MTSVRYFVAGAFMLVSASTYAQQEYDPISKYSSKFSDSATELVGEYSKSINKFLDKQLGKLGVGGVCGIDFNVSIPVDIPSPSCEKFIPEIGYEADFSYDLPRPGAMDKIEEFSQTPEGFE